MELGGKKIKEEKLDKVQTAFTSFCTDFSYLKEHWAKIAIVTANMVHAEGST